MAVIMRRRFGEPGRFLALVVIASHGRSHRERLSRSGDSRQDDGKIGICNAGGEGSFSRAPRPRMRAVEPFGRERENLDAALGDPDRVLELRRQRAVARHRGPAVGEHLHVRAAEIDHRLDGEEHAGLEHDAFAGAADMDDVGLVVEQPAEAVAAEIAHHAHVLRLDIGLDGGADVAGGGARPDHRDAAHHGLVGDLDQPFGAARDGADREHAAGIAMPAVEDQRHVDIDDVAFLQRLLARDAVADDVVDRGAGGLAVAAIHQRRRRAPCGPCAKSNTSRSMLLGRSRPA